MAFTAIISTNTQPASKYIQCICQEAKILSHLLCIAYGIAVRCTQVCNANPNDLQQLFV